MKTDQELEELLADLTTELIFNQENWAEINRPILPRLDYNVYAYIDSGKLLSDGSREKAIKTIMVKYNGEISYSNHL